MVMNGRDWQIDAPRQAVQRFSMYPDALQERFDTHDLDHPHDVVGEPMKAHLSVELLLCLGQEMGGAHPGFESAKRVLGRAPSSYRDRDGAVQRPRQRRLVFCITDNLQMPKNEVPECPKLI